MKFKMMATTIALLTNLFGWAKVPIKEGKLDLKEEEDQKLSKKFGEQTAKDIVDAINKEIGQVQKANQDNQDLAAAQKDLEKIQAEVNKVLEGTNLSDEEKAAISKDDGNGVDGLTAKLDALQKANQRLDAMVSKLINDPEGDRPDAIVNRNNNNMEHSATHLFGTGQKWDAFDKRPWNQRLRDHGMKATDFNEDSTIPLLQDDLKHFVRENPQALESMFNDFEDLPSEWDRRSGVVDRVADAVVIAGEIVQGRAKGWAPKNKFKIAAEEGRVFRKKIDITFSGYELQEIENTWIRGYNKEGSQPWKMSFIGFLLGELIKQQKLDDRKAQINGIYVESPEGFAGAAVNSQDGLRYLYWYFRDVAKKYRPFTSSLGEPTKANIVDYVKEMIESIPQEERNEQGMEIQMSPEMLSWYREKAATIYQVHRSSDEGKLAYGLDYPIDYPNYKFQPLKDFTKTKFIAITKSKNVQILDYKENEKRKFTITHEKRDTNIFADYRLGIRLKFVGTKLASGEPANFERQVVWSNDVPVFDSSVTVPVFDDETGVVKVHFNNMKVDKTWTSDITEFEGAAAGTILRITGNTSMAGAKLVKKNANNLLASDFDLSTGGTLILYANADGTVKELKRISAAEGATVTGEFIGTTFDANASEEFYFTDTSSKTLTEILNGNDGKTIKIYGTNTASVNLTVSDVSDNIDVTADAVLATKADFIELVRVDGVWTEVSRTIA